MGSLIKNSSRWLAGMRRQHDSSRVVYTRVDSSESMPATIGSAEVEAADASGLVLRVQKDVFEISVEDLQLDGVRITPEPGDRISYSSATYEVSSPGAGISHWEWDTAHRNRYRIFVKQVDSQ